MPWILSPSPATLVGASVSGAGAVPVPHWNYPVTFSTTNGVGVVQQDTLEEIFANVKMTVTCPQGACPELPDVGVPSVAFGQAPIDPAPIVQAVQLQEPRATGTVISQAVGDATFGSWLIAHTTQYAGGDK